MRRLLPWIALGGAGLFFASQMGGASVKMSADCSTFTVRGGQEALYNLFSEHVSEDMATIADTLAETGQLPSGLQLFIAMFRPFVPDGCGPIGPNVKVDLGGGQVTTLGELAAVWDEESAWLQDEIDAYMKAQEAGEDIPDIDIPSAPEPPALPGVTDPVDAPTPGPGEPPSMGWRRPQPNPVRILVEHAKRSNRGRVGAGYYVQRGASTPRKKVKALVGARVVRSPADTDAMLRGARR